MNSRRIPRSWLSCFEQSFGQCLGHVAVVVGSESDRYLEHAEAVGEARDPSTVILSTRLFALPPALQKLVVGHELAHTIQLARGGSDREESLESEAWRASVDALAGRKHPIRGKARHPLRAKAFVDPKKPGKAALEYYTLFNKEPVDSKNLVTVESPAFVKPMSLLALLTAIDSHSKSIKGKGLFLVTHGTPQGLSIQIFDKQKKKFLANTQSLTALMTDSAANLARGTGFPEKDFQDLQTKMKAVQGLGIKRLDFRGCSIGSNKESLQKVRDFFGAAAATAPDLLTNFGWITPTLKTYDKAKWEQELKKLPNKVAIETTDKGEHIAVSVNPATGSSHALVESVAAVKWWMSKYLPSPNSSATPYSGGVFPVHSLSTNPVTFPLQSGYAGHIVLV